MVEVKQEGANPKRPYYPALDGMRAIAVVMVFAIHYLNLQPGWAGVNIFFVLSGFLITGILYDSQDKPHRFRDFYMRRSLRIFPLYYAVLFGLLLCTPWLHIDWKPINVLWSLYLGNFIRLAQWLWPAHQFSLGIISYPVPSNPAQLLYLNSGHFWSLCLEEQFYLFWPFLVFTVRHRLTLLRISFGVIVSVITLRLLCFFIFSKPLVAGEVLHWIILFRLDEFMVGAAAALLLRGPEAARLRAGANWFFWSALGVFLFFRLYPRLFHHRGMPNPTGSATWMFYCGITAADVLALGMILMCLNRGSWFERVMNVGPLRALGKISYGFYVFHDLPHNYYAYWCMHHHLTTAREIASFSFVATLLLSVTSYFCLERPFLRLKLRYEG